MRGRYSAEIWGTEVEHTFGDKGNMARTVLRRRRWASSRGHSASVPIRPQRQVVTGHKRFKGKRNVSGFEGLSLKRFVRGPSGTVLGFFGRVLADATDLAERG